MFQPHLRVRLIFHLSESLPPGGRGTAIVVVGARVYEYKALALWRALYNHIFSPQNHKNLPILH